MNKLFSLFLTCLCVAMIGIYPSTVWADSDMGGVPADPPYEQDDSCISAPEGGDNLLTKTLEIAANGNIFSDMANVGSNSENSQQNANVAAQVTNLATLSYTLAPQALVAFIAQDIIDGFKIMYNQPPATAGGVGTVVPATDATCANIEYMYNMVNANPQPNPPTPTTWDSVNNVVVNPLPVNYTPTIDTITFCYDPIMGPGMGYRISNIENLSMAFSTLGDGSQNCSGSQVRTWQAANDPAPHQLPTGGTVNLAKFQAYFVADKICIQLYDGVQGWLTMGCRFRTRPADINATPACYVGQSCVNGIAALSQVPMPISGKIVECFKETLNSLFINTNSCSGGNTTPQIDPNTGDYMRNTSTGNVLFGSDTGGNVVGYGYSTGGNTTGPAAITEGPGSPGYGTSSNIYTPEIINGNPQGSGNRINMFQNFKLFMMKIVTTLLTLYVILFSIKVVLGSNPPNTGEIFMFIIRMVMVIYFSLGSGATDLVYPMISDASASLSQIFFSAGGGVQASAFGINNNLPAGDSGLCYFNPATYPMDPTDTNVNTTILTDPNSEFYGLDISDMPLWDSMDCRLGYYLMLYPLAPPNVVGCNMIGATGNTTVHCPNTLSSQLFTKPLIIEYAWVFIFDLQLFAALVCIFLAILFIMVAGSVVYTYLISMIMITFTVYLAPLVIPLSLFDETRPYFESWKKILVSFMIQPVILFAFTALMLTTLDSIYFGSCPFYSITAQVGDGTTEPVHMIRLFFMDNATIQNWRATPADYNLYTACTSTMGYALYNTESNAVTLNLIFFQVSLPAAVSDMPPFTAKGMLPLLLFIFLFLYFAETLLGSFASDVMGTFALGTDVFSKKPSDLVKAAVDGVKSMSSKGPDGEKK